MVDARPGFLGSGLPLSVLTAIITVSIAIFLFWSGPLWLAAHEASHLSRMLVSYGVVPPLLVVALIVLKQWSWHRLLTCTAFVWGIKLLVTESLYLGLVSLGTEQYSASRPWEAPRAKTETSSIAKYGVAAGATLSGEIRGRVTRAGSPAAGQVVYVSLPGPGRALASGVEHHLAIRENRYQPPVQVVGKKDQVRVENLDHVLHTLRLASDKETVSNTPIPAGSRIRAIPLPAPGRYTMSCETHGDEHGFLVVLDHPYFTTTDVVGRFTLAGLPVGETTVFVMRDDGEVETRKVHVAEGVTVMEIDQ